MRAPEFRRLWIVAIFESRSSAMMWFRLGEEPSRRRRPAAFAPIFEIPGHSRFGRFNSRFEAKNFPCPGTELARKTLLKIVFLAMEGGGNRSFSREIPVVREFMTFLCRVRAGEGKVGLRRQARSWLLDLDALGQVARLVDIAALDDRGAIGEELDRNGVEQGCDKLVAAQHRGAEGEPAFVARDPGRVLDHHQPGRCAPSPPRQGRLHWRRRRRKREAVLVDRAPDRLRESGRLVIGKGERHDLVIRYA